jgi:hypothetical protein
MKGILACKAEPAIKSSKALIEIIARFSARNSHKVDSVKIRKSGNDFHRTCPPLISGYLRLKVGQLQINRAGIVVEDSPPTKGKFISNGFKKLGTALFG